MIKDITVYTRTTCAPCRALKNWLSYKKLNYNEVNLDDDPDAMGIVMKLSNLAMVPCTIITKHDNSKQVISGYNLPSLSSAFRT